MLRKDCVDSGDEGTVADGGNHVPPQSIPPLFGAFRGSQLCDPLNCQTADRIDAVTPKRTRSSPE